MDFHAKIIEEMCRLCGKNAKTGATSKLTMSKDIKRILGLSIEEDIDGVHPKSVCGACRMKISRWKKKKATQRQSLPPLPSIALHQFEAHTENCNVCADSSWDVDKLLLHCQRIGYVAWKKGNKLLAVILDNEARQVLKRIAVEDKTVTTEILGRPVMLSSKLPTQMAEELLGAHICKGNTDFKELAEKFQDKGFLNIHGGKVANVEPFYVIGDTVFAESTIRHVNCKVIAELDSSSSSNLYLCTVCKHHRASLFLSQKRQDNRKTGTVKQKHVPNVFLNATELREKASRLQSEKKMLQKRNEALRHQLETVVARDGLQLDEDRELEMDHIVQTSAPEIEKCFATNGHVKLLWEQQRKAFANKSLRQMRWHPSIIKWAVAIHTKSPSAYNVVRKSGFMTLPHPNTLYRYTHFTNPSTGINPELLMYHYTQNVANLKEHEKVVNLVLDEMKVKSGLFFSKSSGKLVGFEETVNLEAEMKSFEQRCTEGPGQEPELASHVLMYMARGVTSSLKFPVAYFATTNATGSQLYQTTMECIKALTAMGLTVLCVTADGASPNRKMYEAMSGPPNPRPQFKSPSCYAEEENVFCICDAPHLLKTIRNNFENSNWNRKTRNLIFKGQKIQWTQLLELQEWDQGRHRSAPGLQLVPKLSYEHLHLTPGLRMKVNLAAQVMSNTVANALEALKKPGLDSTVHFIRSVNKFFDCLNVSSVHQGRNTRNENLLPYRSVDDPRLHWLQNEFLAFLTEWEEEGKSVEGLSKKERERLCLSRPTLFGCFITVNSFVAVVHRLLSMEGVGYVLSDKLNQDPLEEFFGKQRAAGGQRDNPTVEQFGHSLLRNIVAGKRSAASSKGNVSSKDNEDSESEQPLPKRKRSSKPGYSKQRSSQLHVAERGDESD